MAFHLDLRAARAIFQDDLTMRRPGRGNAILQHDRTCEAVCPYHGPIWRGSAAARTACQGEQRYQRRAPCVIHSGVLLQSCFAVLPTTSGVNHHYSMKMAVHSTHEGLRRGGRTSSIAKRGELKSRETNVREFVTVPRPGTQGSAAAGSPTRREGKNSAAQQWKHRQKNLPDFHSSDNCRSPQRCRRRTAKHKL